MEEIQDEKSLNFGHVTRLNELEDSAQGMSWRMERQSCSNDGISLSINDKQIETQQQLHHLYQEDVMNSNDYNLGGVHQIKKRQRKAMVSQSEDKQEIVTELENQLGEFKLPKI